MLPVLTYCNFLSCAEKGRNIFNKAHYLTSWFHQQLFMADLCVENDLFQILLSSTSRNVSAETHKSWFEKHFADRSTLESNSLRVFAPLSGTINIHLRDRFSHSSCSPAKKLNKKPGSCWPRSPSYQGNTILARSTSFTFSLSLKSWSLETRLWLWVKKILDYAKKTSLETLELRIEFIIWLYKCTKKNQGLIILNYLKMSLFLTNWVSEWVSDTNSRIFKSCFSQLKN